MKRDTLIYWIATLLVGSAMVFSGVNYFINPEMKDGFTHLGFPSYFRVELGIAKIIGAVALIIPGLPYFVKEWAYAGLGITFISASIAHINSGDPSGMVIAPLVFLMILVVSYWYFHKKSALVSRPV